MTEPTDNPTSRRRAIRYVIPGVLFCALLAGVAWYFSGRRVWTDDRTIRVRGDDAVLREVLWTAPQPPAEFFNTADEEYEPSLSPDGTELYFVRGKPGRNAEIFVSRRQHGRWQQPTPLAEVNSPADDLGPRFTPDGRFLLFYSDREGGIGGYDLWAVERSDDGSWGQAFNLGTSVNTEFNEYSPAPTPDGLCLYFASNRRAASAEQKQAWRATIRQSAVGDYDLYVSDREVYATPVSQPATVPIALDADVGATLASPSTAPTTSPAVATPGPEERAGQAPPLQYRAAAEVPGVNTPFHEGASCVSSAGDFLYFASNRPGGVGKFDIYRCRLRDDGSLSPPENLGRQVNTPENETDPSLAVGGFRLLFSSDRDSPLARGGYDLLESDSREVYPVRVPRPTPTLGWSWWVLLGAVLLLLPLLSFFKGWNDHRLNLLQKCLLVSLLFHVLLTIALSLVAVTKQVVEMVRAEGGGMEGMVAVGPGGGGGSGGAADIGAEVRRQISDTVVDMPEPAGLSQEQVAAAQDLGIEPRELAVDVPGAAQQSAEGMTVQVRPPARPADAALAADRVTVAPPTQSLPPAAPELNFDASMRIAQVAPEVRPSGEAPAPQAQRAAPSAAPSATPQAVALGVQPAGAASGGSGGQGASGGGGGVASAPHLVRPNMLSISGAGAARSADANLGAAALGAGPAIQGPSVASERVAAAGPAGPGTGSGVEPGSLLLERQGSPGGGSNGNGGGPGAIDAGIAATPAPTSVGTGGAGAGVGAPAPGPRVDQLVSGAGAGAPGPVVPNATVDLPAGPPTLVGGNRGAGSPKGVAAPSPAIAVVEGAPAQGRAQVAGGPAAGAGTSGAPQAISVASAPVGAGQLGRGIGAPSPARRPVTTDAPGGTGGAPVAAASAPAPSGPNLSPIAPPASAGAGRVASPSAPTGPTSGTEPLLAAARLGAAGDGVPAGPGALPRVGDPTAAPAIGAAAGTGGGIGGAGAGFGPRAGDIVPVPLNLEVSIAGPHVAAPAPLSQRSVEARKPLIEKLGGSKQSEDAVARALSYLSREQEPDGRWTYVTPGSERGERGRFPHDTALTGLATLCFLAADHTPSRTGPYREAVANGVNFLITRQKANGDLRGSMPGGGSDAGNMYDHAIATLALAEAALMTGDAKTSEAAMKGAQFIVRAQNRETGGWRYTPGEYGDTSVFGWQVMALHSAQQLGFEWPQESRDRARKYVQMASRGQNKVLAGYQPGHGATPPMTAELLFSRILLGDKLTPEAQEEACAYLTRQSQSDFYGMYYASLSLIQLRNETWDRWNRQTRDALVAMQRRGGDDDGCWDMNIRWGERAGRVYSTALGCLTLEVYYRYLPISEDNSASRPSPELPDVGYLPR